jgi:hypothetical protein
VSRRKFYSDAALNACLEHFGAMNASDFPLAMADQMAAAGRDTFTLWNQYAERAEASGLSGEATVITAHSSAITSADRRFLRMLLAALSANPERLCPHWREIRPQLVLCDPPAVVCQECAPTAIAGLKTSVTPAASLASSSLSLPQLKGLCRLSGASATHAGG